MRERQLAEIFRCMRLELRPGNRSTIAAIMLGDQQTRLTRLHHCTIAGRVMQPVSSPVCVCSMALSNNIIMSAHLNSSSSVYTIFTLLHSILHHRRPNNVFCPIKPNVDMCTTMHSSPALANDSKPSTDGGYSC